MTKAKAISELFDNRILEKWQWGHSISNVALRWSVDHGFWANRERYEFADGSAIVVAPGSWGIEGSEPFSFRREE